MKLLLTLALAALLPWLSIRPASPFTSQASNPVASAPAANAASTGSAQIRFTYENPMLQPAKYVVLVEENGSGHYSSELGKSGSGLPADQASIAAPSGQLPAVAHDRAIRISEATRQAIFSAARKSKYFTIDCEAKGLNIAFQGKKTLEYSGVDGHGSCTYNWSQDKLIQKLTDTFEGISFTLEEGAKLEVEYQHSRLLLDPELETLEGQAQNGAALELNNIAPILMKIAGDDAVLMRARRRARDLLAPQNRSQKRVAP